MAEKRSYSGDSNGQNGAKRARSNNGSPAPSAMAPPPSIQDQMAAIKTKAAAAKAMARPAEFALPSSTTMSPAEAARAKMEAMKARVAAATASSNGSIPPARAATSPALPPSQLEFEDGPSRARGGLGIGLHPSLMGDIGQDRTKNRAPIGSKFSTTIGNRRQTSPVPEPSALAKQKNQLDLTGPSLEEIRKDPYFDPNVNVVPGTRGRKSRDLLFHQKGKFIAQAAALRKQAHLEDMKKRIAASAKKAGLDDDRSEQAFLVPEPPKAEWWDEGLIIDEEYPDFEDDAVEAEKNLKIDTDDSVITCYVQHPVLLAPPQEKTIPTLKPMFMTKEEQAKKRRQDRMEVRKEKQAKVRLGLEPPEPPKVKKSNLMRVLGDQAVKDPTAVEARVNREIGERAEKHEMQNEERKLTKEEKLEKIAKNQEKDAEKGLHCCVFRIDTLAYGKHRYLIDINAKQQSLTGITILHPRCNVVIVEGGEWALNKYKKLMLKRIDWSEIAPPTASALDNDREHHPDIAEKHWLRAEDEQTGELRDFSKNQCVLVWEGAEKLRSFKKWGSRVCETDAEARRALERSKMENMWQTAKNWVG